MSTPFPTDPAGRQALAALMPADFLAEVNALRKQFPGSKLAYFKAGDVEVGDGGKDGWVVDEAFLESTRADLDRGGRSIQKAIRASKKRNAR
jgi:hypothetical protein